MEVSEGVFEEDCGGLTQRWMCVSLFVCSDVVLLLFWLFSLFSLFLCVLLLLVLLFVLLLRKL